jgi:hypothetical protein
MACDSDGRVVMNPNTEVEDGFSNFGHPEIFPQTEGRMEIR